MSLKDRRAGRGRGTQGRAPWGGHCHHQPAQVSSRSGGAGQGEMGPGPDSRTTRPAAGTPTPARSCRSFPPGLAESWGPWESAGAESPMPPRRRAAPPPPRRPFLFLFVFPPPTGSALLNSCSQSWIRSWRSFLTPSSKQGVGGRLEMRGVGEARSSSLHRISSFPFSSPTLFAPVFLPRSRMYHPHSQKQ